MNFQRECLTLRMEVLKLKTDAEYEEKLNALRKVVETVQSIVLDEIDGN